MSEDQEQPEDVLSEGGGPGGGTEAVHQVRLRTSPLRGIGLVVVAILAIIVVLVPVIRIIWGLVTGAVLTVGWIIISTLAVILAVFTLYYLFRKSI
jgi:hypothetical protein